MCRYGIVRCVGEFKTSVEKGYLIVEDCILGEVL